MHVARNAPAIHTIAGKFTYKDYRTMGQVVHESLGKAAYTIAFTAYSGKSANPFSPQRPLAAPDPESIETLFQPRECPTQWWTSAA